MRKLPIYPVQSPWLYAGGYPLWILEPLVEMGVRCFVDLTDPEELAAGQGDPCYRVDLQEIGRQQGVELTVHSFPIEDFGVPSVELLERVLDQIDADIAQENKVYVHCWGGYGRTGIVVGAWLIRHGWATAANFVNEIAERRQALPNHYPSPVTEEQTAFVRRFAATNA